VTIPLICGNPVMRFGMEFYTVRSIDLISERTKPFPFVTEECFQVDALVYDSGSFETLYVDGLMVPTQTHKMIWIVVSRILAFKDV
jgi:hypothetical protein